MTVRPLRFATGFESTYLPGYDVDGTELSGHDRAWRTDLDAVRADGVRIVRYPVRWHRIEAEPGRYDWTGSDQVLGHLLDSGVEPVVDLVHHTSYPAWLTGGFWDSRFDAAYQRFAEAVAIRYPWLPAYTVFNEPFATLFLAGHESLWPPYGRGMAGFVRTLTNVLPAVCRVGKMYADLLPAAKHVWVDTCEHHAGTPGRPAEHAAMANDRRFTMLDLYLGHALDPGRPFLGQLIDAGGESLLSLPTGRIDVLGLDYYPHSEWWYDEQLGHAPSPYPRGLGAVLGDYADRYGLPLAVTETNIRGFPSDHASWLRYTLEQCERARAEGVPIEWYCWFPYVDSRDWDSLLARPGGRPDPVGVRPANRAADTSMTRAWRAAVSGVPAADLPAYRFREPVSAQLSGYLPQLAHWPWQDPPDDEPTTRRADGADGVDSGDRWNQLAAQDWRRDAELHHGFAVSAATAGLRDPALGEIRVTGAHAAELAEAAVSSATPFLRAPLLSRLAEALALHSGHDEEHRCLACGHPAPCPTERVLRR